MSEPNPAYYSPRYNHVSVNYSWLERLDLWKCNIRDWLASFPCFSEKEHCKYVELKPGDEGYDEAQFGINWVSMSDPPRFEFKDGEFHRV